MRQLKSINVNYAPSATIKDIENIPNLKEIIYNETYEAIRDVATTQQNIAQLFEINNSGYIVELEEKQWIPALERALKFYEKVEEYEKCSLHKTLIEQINERRSKQNITGRKQYVKRKNTSKKKEKNNSSTK